MRTAIKLMLACCGPILLMSCGENKVKLDVARSLSDNINTSMAGTASYLDESENRRRAALAALVASDPNCLPDRRITLQRPTAENPRGSNAPLCPRNGRASQGYQTFQVDLTRTPEEVLKPRVIMITAVADYGRAIAKILDNKSADVTGELTRFAEKVDRVHSLVQLLAQDESPTLGGQLQSDEGKSILALLEFVEDLHHEARQVGRVEALVERDGVKVDDALEKLRLHTSVRVAGTLRNYAFVNRNSLYRTYQNNRFGMSVAERRAAVMEIFLAQDYESELPQKAKLVDTALAETQAAQKGLRQALANRFTPAQRRKVAAENLDRITNAMKMVASIGTAFS